MSMSDVVIRSTENGPNLVIVDGKVVQAWCRCGGSTLMPFCDGTHKKNGFTAKTHEVRVRKKRTEKIWRVPSRVPGQNLGLDLLFRTRPATTDRAH